MPTLVMLLALSALVAQRSEDGLVETFGPGWTQAWMERKLDRRPSRYTVVQEDGNAVLMAQSERGASGLWYSLKLHPASGQQISWRWKVKEALPSNQRERQRRGDDYAARVFVGFEPHLLSWKRRALCYVWASREAVGSVYKSPYAGSVKTVVLQSGNERSGQWVRESRDVVADYRAAFGREPEVISGVAVMADSDDTGGTSQAWFDDLVLQSNGTVR